MAVMTNLKADRAPGPARPPESILAVDTAGGARLKILASGESEPRR